MSYQVTTAATAEPLTLDFVKDWLKVDFADDDAIITAIIKGARSAVENYTGRVLMLQTVEKTFDQFPDYNCSLELESAPVHEVLSVKYLDEDGNEATWADGNYKVTVQNDITLVTPKNTQSFPTVLSEVAAITVEYRLGYPTADDVPGAIVQAMLLIIAKMYEQKEDSIKSMPNHSEWLLSPYKIFQ